MVDEARNKYGMLSLDLSLQADKKTAKAEKRSAEVDIILRAAARDQDPVAVLRKRVVQLEAEMRGLRSLNMEWPASSFHQCVNNAPSVCMASYHYYELSNVPDTAVAIMLSWL